MTKTEIMKLGLRSYRKKAYSSNNEHCKDCTNCVVCSNCKDCDSCVNCTDCKDCYDCRDCKNCKDCIDCSSLISKRYRVNNVQLTKAEFYDFIGR